MATTSIFIEIVVTGIFTLAWVLLLLARLNIFHPSTLLLALAQYKDWSTPILVAIFAIVYVLGIAMNTASYILVMNVLKGQKIRDDIFQGETTFAIWARVWQHGSDALTRDVVSTPMKITLVLRIKSFPVRGSL